MKLTFDPRHNIAYIQIRESKEKEEVETIRLSDEILVDISPDGTLYGIELLNATRQLGAGAAPKLSVVNEESGLTAEYNLPL